MRTQTVLITQQIIVDSEIADEIVWLNANGVRTESSCSGHDKSKATAMIKPSGAERAQELGYQTQYIEDRGLFEIKLRGYMPESSIVLKETGQQPYTDTKFSAGLVEGHAHDTIYLKLERGIEEPLTLFLRHDEALTLIWLLSGALWSEQVRDNIVYEIEKATAGAADG